MPTPHLTPEVVGLIYIEAFMRAQQRGVDDNAHLEAMSAVKAAFEALPKLTRRAEQSEQPRGF